MGPGAGRVVVVVMRNSTREAGLLSVNLESVIQPFGCLHRLFNRREPLCEHEVADFPGLVRKFALAFANRLGLGLADLLLKSLALLLCISQSAT